MRMVGKISGALIISLLYSVALGKEVGIPNPPPPDPPKIVLELPWKSVSINKYKCDNKRIKDADTFICDVIIEDFNVILVKQDVRVVNYDAPEISHKRQSVKVTEIEIKKGIEAKNYFESLASQYDFYISPASSKDPYGRFLCSVWLSDKDHPNQYLSYSEVMTLKGYVR